MADEMIKMLARRKAKLSLGKLSMEKTPKHEGSMPEMPSPKDESGYDPEDEKVKHLYDAVFQARKNAAERDYQEHIPEDPSPGLDDDMDPQSKNDFNKNPIVFEYGPNGKLRRKQ